MKGRVRCPAFILTTPGLMDLARRIELSPGDMIPIYKICSSAMWREAQRSGMFRGSSADQRDGFIHFSTAAQVAETAAKHFAGERNLVLLTVDSAALGDALKWEPSRGGALFPHLYGDLDMGAVVNAAPLPLGQDGQHVFPTMS